MPSLVGKGTLSVAFVRPSVAYIANNSRTRRPSVPNFGKKIPTFDANCIPVSRSKVKVINADTHRAPYLSERQGLWTSNLVYGRTTTTRISHGCHDVADAGQGRKVARSRDQSEPSWRNAVPVSLEAGGGIPCRPNPAATLLVVEVINKPC